MAWLETHLHLLETMAAVVEHRLREAEHTVSASLELCARLAAEEEPARRLELQAAGTQAMVSRAIAAAQARYELIMELQKESLELLRRRVTGAIANVEDRAVPGGRVEPFRRDPGPADGGPA